MGWGIGNIFTDPIGTISNTVNDIGTGFSNLAYGVGSGISNGIHDIGSGILQNPIVDAGLTGAATYFGTPWAGAAVNTALTANRGGSAGQSLAAGAMTYAGGTLAGAGSSGTDTAAGSTGQGLSMTAGSGQGLDASGAGGMGFQGTPQSTGFGGSLGSGIGGGAGSAAGGGYGSTPSGGQPNTGSGNMDINYGGDSFTPNYGLDAGGVPGGLGMNPSAPSGMGLNPSVPDPSTMGQGSSLWDQLTQKMGNMGWKDWGKAAMGGLQMYGGYQNYQLAQQQLQQQQNYQNQLNALMANPSSIQNLPGYQAGLNAVQRSMAAQGYQGSGNMAGAVSNYGMNIYNQQQQQLQQLANQRVSSPYSGLMQMGAGAMSWF